MNGDSTYALDSPDCSRAALIEYWLERAAWVIGTGAILLALAGYLGPGPLGVRRLSTPDGSLAAQYYAVHRYEAPAELAIFFAKSTDEESLQLAIDRSFTDQATIETISPIPAAARIEGNRIIYEFRALDVPSGSFITYRYKHDDYGWLRYSVSFAGQPGLEVTQLVLP
jgi:hypothetical protein